MTKKGQRKTSVELFGSFIDTYRLREAEEDGVIVPILYEGFKVKGALQDGQDMDELFEEEFEDLTDEERQQLHRRWATKGTVSTAQKLVDVKAKHMLRHYVDKVLPEGFKAQVVAHDRETTVRYREAFLEARDELVRDIEKLSPHLLTRSLDELRPRQAQLVKAHRQLDLIKRMDFVPVISEGTPSTRTATPSGPTRPSRSSASRASSGRSARTTSPSSSSSRCCSPASTRRSSR
nr:hypothetical protein GCM10020093_051810 [Planobispora longispora]